MGTSPTLSVVRAAYTEEVAELWLMAQVENLNDFCGVSRKMTFPQMQELARMMLVEVPYLKTAELMMFFHRFKAGHYGEFFGVVDPQRVLSGLQAYLCDRRSELDRYQREKVARQRDAAREASSARAITYAEYCQLKSVDAISRQGTCVPQRSLAGASADAGESCLVHVGAASAEAGKFAGYLCRGELHSPPRRPTGTGARRIHSAPLGAV